MIYHVNEQVQIINTNSQLDKTIGMVLGYHNNDFVVQLSNPIGSITSVVLSTRQLTVEHEQWQ